MPASATPQAGPAAAAQPEPNAEPTRSQSQAKSATADVRPEREEGASNGSAPDVTNEEFARHLNLPPGVMEQVKSSEKAAKRKPEEGGDGEGPAGEEEGGERPTSNVQRPTPNEEEEGEGDHEEIRGEVEGEEEAEGAEEEGAEESDEPLPKDVRKLQKRVKRLTRRLREQERAREALEDERETWSEQQGAETQRAIHAAPSGRGALGTARTEADLDKMVAVAKATRKLVRENPEGIQEGEGENAKFHSPDALREWDERAEDILLEAEVRRRELREFRSARQHHDDLAKKEFPGLFDKGSKEFQTAVALAGKYPWVRDIPEANYALGVLVEGLKAINARKRTDGKSQIPKPKSQNGEYDEDEELDERLTPEYQREHIPPTAAPIPNKPPQRTPASAGANAKKVEEVAKKFTRPGGATMTNLADAFRILDEEEDSPSRRRVAV